MFAFIQNTTGFSLGVEGWPLYLTGTLLLILTAGIIFIIDRYYFAHKNRSKDEQIDKNIYAPKLLYIAIAISVLLYIIVEVTNIVTNT